jgi:universal stress protein A
MPSQDEVLEEFAREFIRRHETPRPLRPIGRILAATDFSLCSLAALEYAEDLARQFGAELCLLHATGPAAIPAEVGEVGREPAERTLARSVERLRVHGLAARGLLRTGGAAEAILKVAAAERASLIVMGTHGRSGISRVLMGSVAELVVRDAPCPVLTVGLPKTA